MANNAQLPEIQHPLKENKISKTKAGSLKTRSKKSSENDSIKSEDASHKIVEEHTTSGNHCAGNENNGIANYKLGNFIAKNKYESATKKEADEVCCSQYSSPVDDSLVDKRPSGIAETYNKRPTFFCWIRSWWPFWKSNAKSDDLTAQQNNVVSHLEDKKLSELDWNVFHSGKPKLFSSDSFWNDLESFIFTPKGSLLVSKSKSRLVCIIVLYTSSKKVHFAMDIG